MAVSKKGSPRLSRQGAIACGGENFRYQLGMDIIPAQKKALARVIGKARNPMERVCDKESEAALNRRLRDDIEKNGQLIPIIVGKDGQVIDGRQRLRACQDLGIEVRAIEVDCDAGDAWWSSNVIRRHLTVGERTLLATLMFKARKELGVTQEQIAEQCGISVDSIKRAEALIESCPAMVKEVAEGKSLSGLQNLVRARQESAKVERIKKSTGNAASAWEQMVAEGAKFQVIYADPPWDYGAGDKEVTTSAQPGAHYQVMTLDAIRAMGDEVKKMASADAVCWMWVPSCLVADGVRVMEEAWGFKVAATQVWIKDRACVTKGAVRPRHEIVIIGAKPTVIVEHEFVIVGHRGKGGTGLKAGAVDSVHEEARRAHSQKPEWYAEQIEALYPDAAKLEMFCRTPRPGWTAWGNQAQADSEPISSPKPARKTAKAKKAA